MRAQGRSGPGDSCLQERDEEALPWAGDSPPCHLWERQAGEQASGALLPGGLRSEQQSATPKPNPAELLGVYCLRTNQRSGVFSEIWGETVDGGT